MTEWQPIETVPRDGTTFDAWVPDAFGGHRMTGLSFNWRGKLRQHGLLTEKDLPRWPTYWIPLPNIAAEIPDPVDPDLIEAREIYAARYERYGDHANSRDVRAGLWDRGDDYISNLTTAIKRGRELEREGK